jgi:CheY-like chemotaxis protein
VLVACRSADSGSQASIEVWDSGLGIAPEHQEDVFKEFYQVANPARQRTLGMGLGLSIVRRSCKLLTHPLALSSRLGVGTRFSVRVPRVVPGPEQDAAAAADLPEKSEGLLVTVLVIEDDDMVRQALVGLLQSWGMTVAEASDLQGAQGLIEHGLVPGLIISDYRLNETLNGILVVARLRQQLGSSVPACLISGDIDPALIQDAQQAGLTLLHKPVRPAKLRNLLRHLVADQRDCVGGTGS